MPAVHRHLRAIYDALAMDNFAGYSAWLRANNCGNATITSRFYVLTEFARDFPMFPNVSPGDVTGWLGREGYAPWTRSTYYGHLRSYFRYAVVAGIIDTDPMKGMRRPKPGRSAPRPLTRAQVHLVLGAATNLNMHAWLTLGLLAGLRAHEVAKIRGEDVDQDQMYVLGKGGVGAYLPTHPLIWELALTRPRVGWWFPTGSACGHVTSEAVSTLTGRLFTRYGIAGSIHRCRHTFATELLRAGVNIRVVQTLMRHASLDSTMIYTAVDEGERLAAINLLSAA